MATLAFDLAAITTVAQSGYSAEFILELCLDSLNGLHNRPAKYGSKRQPDPEFFQVWSLIDDVQDAGALGMKVKKPKDGDPSTIIFFHADNVSEEIQAKSAKLRHLLGVSPSRMDFKLVYSPLPGEEAQFTVGTRSLWQILGAYVLRTHRWFRTPRLW